MMSETTDEEPETLAKPSIHRERKKTERKPTRVDRVVRFPLTLRKLSFTLWPIIGVEKVDNTSRPIIEVLR